MWIARLKRQVPVVLPMKRESKTKQAVYFKLSKQYHIIIDFTKDFLFPKMTFLF